MDHKKNDKKFIDKEQSQENSHKLWQAFESKNKTNVSLLINNVHPAEIANFIEELTPDQREEFLSLNNNVLNFRILAEIYPYIRAEILQNLTDDFILDAVKNLESDDALSVVQDLEENRQKEIIKSLPSPVKEKIEQGLSYPENSAGRLMQREVFVVFDSWSVQKVLDVIERPRTKTSILNLNQDFYEVYIINHYGQPVGKISLSKLLQSNRSELVSQIMDENIHSLSVLKDQYEVADIFRDYSLISAPVVDSRGRLIGKITIDDIVFVIEEKATKDILHLGKVGRDSEFYADIFQTLITRFRWLFITFIDTLLATAVIYQFQDVIEKKVALAVLMPIVAAMGGNSGMQVVTVMVRALAIHDIKTKAIFWALTKELRVSVIQGFIFAVLLASIAGFWFNDFQIACILGLAMIFNIVWAAFGGTLLPYILSRLSFDPAISAGPLLTTTTDILGFLVFLGLAKIFLF